MSVKFGSSGPLQYFENHGIASANSDFVSMYSSISAIAVSLIEPVAVYDLGENVNSTLLL